MIEVRNGKGQSLAQVDSNVLADKVVVAAIRAGHVGVYKTTLPGIDRDTYIGELEKQILELKVLRVPDFSPELEAAVDEGLRRGDIMALYLSKVIR